MITLTIDKNINYQKLKLLERDAVIKICTIRIEKDVNRESAYLPTTTINHVKSGAKRFGSNQQTKVLNMLIIIIGSNNIADCINLEAHIRDERDYFVTEDQDFLDRRAELYKEFSELKIRTVDELINELRVWI